MPRNYSVKETINRVKQRIYEENHKVSEPVEKNEQISVQNLTEEIIENDTSFLIEEVNTDPEKKKTILQTISEKFKFW